VRLNANGGIDTNYLTRDVSASVESIFVDAATNAIIGGSFYSVEGWLRRGLARLTPSGAVDQTFTASNSLPGTVSALRTQSDSNVLAGGTFNFVGPYYRGRIARFTATGVLDLSFVPGAGASGGSSYVDEYAAIYDRSSVLALGAQSDGKIIVGGDFTAFDGMARPYVARLFSRPAADKIFLGASSQQRELRWDTGALQSADNVGGPWTTVPGAVSPWRLPNGGPQKFYRLRFNEQPGN
jgi:hypothetical protein